MVAPFERTEGVIETDAHFKIARAISEQINNLNLDHMQVEVDAVALEHNGSQAQAHALGERYDASLVIWGKITGVDVEVSFLNLEIPDTYAADVTINETARSQIAAPKAYAAFIVDELPTYMTYLSLFAVGQSLVSQGAYTDAIKVIEGAIDDILQYETIPPELVLDTAYFRLGWLYQNIAQIKRSQLAYTQAVALNPEYATAYNNRGITYDSLERYEQTIDDYQTHIALWPDSPARKGAEARIETLEALLSDLELGEK